MARNGRDVIAGIVEIVWHGFAPYLLIGGVLAVAFLIGVIWRLVT